MEIITMTAIGLFAAGGVVIAKAKKKRMQEKEALSNNVVSKDQEIEKIIADIED
jgi:hypothetical protein